MKLSYSRLSTFMNCGLLYRLKYIEKIPARPKPHLGFGRILHATLDKFYSLNTHYPPLAELLNIYKGYWKVGSNSYKRHYAKGLCILKAYYKLNIDSYGNVMYVEQPFEIPIGQHFLVGRFDRVDLLDDVYEIIDYKAAKEIPSQAVVDSDLQLGMYAMAFKMTTGNLPLVSFYFLPKNSKVTSRRSEDDIIRLKSGLDAIVNRMMAGESFMPDEGPECKWCDYKAYCSLKTDDPLDIPIKENQPELNFLSTL